MKLTSNLHTKMKIKLSNKIEHENLHTYTSGQKNTFI